MDKGVMYRGCAIFLEKCAKARGGYKKNLFFFIKLFVRAAEKYAPTPFKDS